MSISIDFRARKDMVVETKIIPIESEGGFYKVSDKIDIELLGVFK